MAHMISAPSSVFLGISGASGAPYALRLAQALGESGCSLSVCISDAGLGVLVHELGLAGGERGAVTSQFLARAGVSAPAYSPDDFAAVVSSGSSFPDAAVVCPCSMSTASAIALGTSSTLIHRAGAVALKERRPLVLVPRETPLSAISLRRLLEVAEAGAVVLPPAPGFYGLPETKQDLIDFVVGKVLTVLGFTQKLYPEWRGLPK